VITLQEDQFMGETALGIDPLLAKDLAETLIIEALAQTAACVMGDARGQHQGLLVSASDFRFLDEPKRRNVSAYSRSANASWVHFIDLQARQSRSTAACRGQMTFSS